MSHVVARNKKVIDKNFLSNGIKTGGDTDDVGIYTCFIMEFIEATYRHLLVSKQVLKIVLVSFQETVQPL